VRGQSVIGDGAASSRALTPARKSFLIGIDIVVVTWGVVKGLATGRAFSSAGAMTAILAGGGSLGT